MPTLASQEKSSSGIPCSALTVALFLMGAVSLVTFPIGGFVSPACADSLAAVRLAATRFGSAGASANALRAKPHTFARPLSAGERLSAGTDVYHSKNQELVLYRFGYRSDRHRDHRFSELSGYHLEDEPASVEERLREEPETALGRLHAGNDSGDVAERFNRAVNKASEVLVGGFALVAEQFLGADNAYAASGEDEELPSGSVLSRPDRERDGLVHF